MIIYNKLIIINNKHIIIKGFVMKKYKKDVIRQEDVGERVFVSFSTRVNVYPKGGFGMFLQKGFRELARDASFSLPARMLFFYMGVVEYDNRIKNYTQQEISEMTNIPQPNVSKATKKLVEDGIIYKDGRDYYFNDKYILKGVKKYRVQKKTE